MNNKIYYNNKFIGFDLKQIQSTQNQIFKIYDVKNKPVLKKIVDDFLEQDNLNSIIILCYDFEIVLEYLKKSFNYIEAAGGFIEKENFFLFIHRLGKWDLPKGKLDAEETIQNAAIRECEEECAVKNLKIKKQLSSTYHLYTFKNNFAIKQTYWFYMTTDYSKKLKPQIEEHIDEVKWFSENDIKTTILADTYLTIKDVIIDALTLIKTDKNSH